MDGPMEKTTIVNKDALRYYVRQALEFDAK